MPTAAAPGSDPSVPPELSLNWVSGSLSPHLNAPLLPLERRLLVGAAEVRQPVPLSLKSFLFGLREHIPSSPPALSQPLHVTDRAAASDDALEGVALCAVGAPCRPRRGPIARKCIHAPSYSPHVPEVDTGAVATEMVQGLVWSQRPIDGAPVPSVS